MCERGRQRWLAAVRAAGVSSPKAVMGKCRRVVSLVGKSSEYMERFARKSACRGQEVSKHRHSFRRNLVLQVVDGMRRSLR